MHFYELDLHEAFFLQIRTLQIDNPDDCAKKFRSNRSVGLLLFLGIIGGKLIS